MYINAARVDASQIKYGQTRKYRASGSTVRAFGRGPLGVRRAIERIHDPERARRRTVYPIPSAATAGHQ